MRITAAMVALVLVGACTSGGNGSADSSSTTGGSSTGTTEAPAGTTYVEPDDCESTQDCDSPQLCVAPYDPGSSARGPAACVNACVEADDVARWCIDDEACCEGLRCNEVDGFCIQDGNGTGTSGSTGAETDTSAGETVTGSSDGGTSSTSSTGGSGTSGSSGTTGTSG